MVATCHLPKSQKQDCKFMHDIVPRCSKVVGKATARAQGKLQSAGLPKAIFTWSVVGSGLPWARDSASEIAKDGHTETDTACRLIRASYKNSTEEEYASSLDLINRALADFATSAGGPTPRGKLLNKSDIQLIF